MGLGPPPAEASKPLRLNVSFKVALPALERSVAIAALSSSETSRGDDAVLG
jgi:hypothetical protein